MTQTPGQWAGQPQQPGQPLHSGPQPYQPAPGTYAPAPAVPPAQFAPQGGFAAPPQPYQAAAQHYPPQPCYQQPGYATAAPPPAGAPECRVCGATPAAKARFSSITGIIATWTVKQWRGLYCRTCGLATFREAMSETLVGGWWLIVSFGIIPLYVLTNLYGRSRVARLAEPTGRRSQPMMSGPPVFARRKVQVVATIGLAMWVLFFTFAKWKS